MGDVVTQWTESQTAVLQFWGLIPAGVNFCIPNLGDHLLGKRTTGVPGTCDRCRSAVQTSAEEEEVLSRRHRDNCSESRRRHQVLFAEMVSANVRDC